MVDVDEAARARRGAVVPDKRTFTVSVRLSADELAVLDERRELVRMRRGEYLRAAALHKLPPTIHPIARDQWAALARAVGNLNQLSRATNATKVIADIEACRAVLAQVRNALIGVKYDAEDEDDEGQD